MSSPSLSRAMSLADAFACSVASSLRARREGSCPPSADVEPSREPDSVPCATSRPWLRTRIRSAVCEISEDVGPDPRCSLRPVPE